MIFSVTNSAPSSNETMNVEIGNNFSLGANSRDACKYFYNLDINQASTTEASVLIPQFTECSFNFTLLAAQDVTLCN
jgi:hypothetical protein|tara:strand:+ start:440 stop:670 length:231 start_codon:yes stop_codon:yes gene_type:complete